MSCCAVLCSYMCCSVTLYYSKEQHCCSWTLSTVDFHVHYGLGLDVVSLRQL